MDTFVMEGGVQRELVKIAREPHPGNDSGYCVMYRDQMVEGDVEYTAPAAAGVGAQGGDGDGPKPTKADLEKVLADLPAQIAAGEYKDAEYVATSLKTFFGKLFTKTVEAQVRAMFAPKGPA